MNSQHKKYKLALLVNIIAPYRVPVYQVLGSSFNLSIFHGGDEQNRSEWQNVESQLNGINIKRSWGITLGWRQGNHGATYDRRFTHITPGYLFDLWQFRPDAVITNEMGFRTLVALIYGSIFRIPVWVWWGGTLHTETSRKLFKKILRRLFVSWVKNWISYGETSTEYLLSLGISKQRILQIQNCVDEKLYLQPQQPKVQLAPKPVFLYVGQLINRKGVDKLLEATAKVQEKGYSFSLLLVGGGLEKAALEDLAQTLNLQNVTFYPSQPPEAMPAIYRSADYLIFPTLEDVWGLVVNESLWSGVPVLSSIYAGCSKELLPNQNTFDPLIEEDFVAAFKRALAGEIAAPDRSRLKTCAEVGELIVNDIKRVLNNQI